MTLSRLVPLLLLLVPLGGCNMVVLDPSGDVAAQQRDLILISTALMLIIIIPVMVLTVLFAWRFRAGNTAARYEPDWDHSTKIELVVWAVPLLIIIVLGAVTWAGTHLLDPYRPLGRIDASTPVDIAAHRPLEVQVVAMDWKWLFIVPEYDVAAVNELAAPVDRPIEFSITATSVMNALYVPALSGMIYAMPGMETKLNAVINHAGEYEGFSANYSGAGFSQMRFAFHGVDQAGFDAWVARAREGGTRLDRPAYLELEKPSEANPVQLYGSVEAGLFDAVVNMCVDPSRMCMRDMMAIDARGGLGLAGLANTLPKDVAAAGTGPVFGTAPRYVASIAGFCTEAEALTAVLDRGEGPVRDRFTPIIGAGLPRPGSLDMTPVRTSSLPVPLNDL